MKHTISTAFVVSALLLALSACQRQEGPAEHAGKEIDKAVAQVGAQVEKAGDQIQDTANSKK